MQTLTDMWKNYGKTIKCYLEINLYNISCRTYSVFFFKNAYEYVKCFYTVLTTKS